MKKKATSILASSIFCLSLATNATIVPEFVISPRVSQAPYSHNGLLTVENYMGSASLVGEGVLTTAAHVIFDDEELVWEPVGQTRFYPQYHRTTTFNPVGDFYPVMPYIRWTSYATRVENDPSGPGLSTPDTFNLDFAVLYLSPALTDDRIMRYPETFVDAEGDVGILRDHRQKTIIGYPSDEAFMNPARIGLMHQTEPADYFAWWGGLEEFPDTWRDSEDFWVAGYDLEGVTTYSGNSGGPIYVANDQGGWMNAGLVVGSNGSDGVLIRGLDENAWALVEEAVAARGTETLFRVNDLTAVLGAGSQVDLNWTDRSADEDRTIVFRKDIGGWEMIAELPPDSSRYLDNNTDSGRVYHYSVQPVKANGNRPPRSVPVAIATRGTDQVISPFTGLDWMKFYSRGDSNWHLDAENRLRAGQIRHMGASSLMLDLIGPGTLAFDWSVSSELNPDYGKPGPDGDDIFDALYLYLNGEPVMEASNPRFLSGEVPPERTQLVLPPGAHLVEWRYEKDPYTSSGEDTAFLASFTWEPGPASPYPVYGAFAFPGTDWHGSNWFGTYSTEAFPWVGHLRLGWLYLYAGNGTDLYFFSPNAKVGHLYTKPGFYPALYHYGRGTWVYFLEESAQFGQDLWFYDLTLQEWFQADSSSGNGIP